MAIEIVERPMTDAEFASMNAGFEALAVERDQPEPCHERHGFVACDAGRFVGCSSGLAYRTGDDYGAWFTLTDLFVEASLRGRGLGRDLLERIEERAAALGIANMLTWSAGFQAPAFYEAAGYTRQLTCEGWYPSGAPRILLIKSLRTHS